MEVTRYQWDEKKCLSSITKHDLDFRDAPSVFEGLHVLGRGLIIQGEMREIATGMFMAGSLQSFLFAGMEQYALSPFEEHVMTREENIVSYTADELREMRARGESKSDFASIDAKDPADLERAALEQLAEDGISPDWYKDAIAVRPDPKRLISLRLDGDVVDWFRNQGPGYQTRMNAVLKAYMKHAPSR